MHSKGLWRPDSEEFSAHPEPSRTPAAHARGRPASSRLLCELLDRILAGAPRVPQTIDTAPMAPSMMAQVSSVACRPPPGTSGPPPPATHLPRSLPPHST